MTKTIRKAEKAKSDTTRKDALVTLLRRAFLLGYEQGHNTRDINMAEARWGLCKYFFEDEIERLSKK
jgi:hypothetical protein